VKRSLIQKLDLHREIIDSRRVDLENIRWVVVVVVVVVVVLGGGAGERGVIAPTHCPYSFPSSCLLPPPLCSLLHLLLLLSPPSS